MDKIKGYLLELSFLLVLVRFIAVPSSISDALVLMTLVGSIVYTKNYLKLKQDAVAEKYEKEFDELKRKVEALTFQNGIKRTNVANEQERKISNSRF
jgi:hypothetical protein